MRRTCRTCSTQAELASRYPCASAQPCCTIVVLVGSKNPQKSRAAQEAFTTAFPGRRVVCLPCDVDPGITDWKTHISPGQPFGLEQTTRGARNRANACAALFAASPDIAAVGASAELGDAPSSATAAAPHDSGDGHNPTADRDGTARVVFAVGFENGLVPARELGRSDLPDESWLDGGVVAVRQLSAPGAASHELRVRQGTFVLTEFHASPDADGATFDAAAASYRALIMPRIHAGEDLFKGWTRDWDGGPFTRDYFLTQVR